MKRLQVTAPQKKAIGISFIIALIGGAYFLKPYFSLIVVSIILAFLFGPVYDKLLAKWGKPGRASMLTFLIASLAVVIPVALITMLCIRQVNNLISNIDYDQLNKTVGELFDKVNELLKSNSLHIDKDAATATIESSLKSASSTIIASIPGIFGGFLSFITSFIIFVYVFLALLINKEKLMSLITTISPVGKEVTGLYAQKMSAMTKATVRGQFIIAFCQGFESAVVLSIVGYSDLFFFFLIFLTAISVIPMGAGIITIPIGIALILTGHVWQGVLVIANHLIIVTNIDNVLRPQLVPKSARLIPALMILAVFSGIAYFGFIGIVLGPVIMIVIVTTIQVFLDVYRNLEMEQIKDDPSQSLYQQISTKTKGIINDTKSLIHDEKSTKEK